MLKQRTAAAIAERHDLLDAATCERAGAIVRDVRQRGEPALREYANDLDGLPEGGPLFFDRDRLAAAFHDLDSATRNLLERTADRIREFAESQRRCLTDLVVETGGMQAGHVCVPVRTAGCYAPGGRYPLPSSVLMTAVTARAAGVTTVVVASPRPGPETMAAAFVAGADGLLPVGGAQAIAALAYGIRPSPRCDIIVGPGNRFVTAAKFIVSQSVGIDMLAGPSELCVLADATADPGLVAADLLAQAEHDPDALPVLVTEDAALAAAVNRALEEQLLALPTADVARAALANGGVVLCDDIAAACAACDRLAPEHLALHVADPATWRERLAHFGAVFEGAPSGEVLGDYGAGPNHVLPTGGQARHTGGLSVFDFLRVRTFLRGVASDDLLRDVGQFAALEGLPGHAAAAAARRL